jgi:hypothetical protein
LSDPDSCGHTTASGNNLDQVTDDAFLIKYTKIGTPTGFNGVCTPGVSVGNFSWDSLVNATSYTLRFNKDPQTDWMGGGDFIVVVNNLSTSYVTGNTAVAWAGGWDSTRSVFHSTNCTNQPTPCVTTGVAEVVSMAANTYYSIAIDGGGGVDYRAFTGLTCFVPPTFDDDPLVIKDPIPPDAVIPPDIVGVGGASSLNQICETDDDDSPWFTGRQVKFEVTATDTLGGGAITEIKLRLANANTENTVSSLGTKTGDWIINGITTSTGVNTKTVTFFMYFPESLNSNDLYNMSVWASNQYSNTGWVNTGRSFKVWDCNVPLSGNMFDSSDVLSAVCSTGDGFTELALPSMNFSSVSIRKILVGEIATILTVPTVDSGPGGNSYSGGSLVWGGQYEIKPNDDLAASSLKYRWIDAVTDVVLSDGCKDVDNTITNNVVDPYNNNPALKVDFSAIRNQDPWMQVVGGGVQSKFKKIDGGIPTTCFYDASGVCIPAMSINSGTLMDNGLVAAPNFSYSSGCIWGEGKCFGGKPNDWRYLGNVVNGNYSYEYFYSNYFVSKGIGYTFPGDTTMAMIKEVGGTGVIFVNGDLDINEDNEVLATTNQFLMIVVKGNINIETSVNKVEGILIANRDIGASGSSEIQLRINGMLVSGADVKLSRGYITAITNNTQPGTVVTYRPDLLFNMPATLSKILTSWKQGR